MEQYARNKKYNNVFFHGAYMPIDRYEFAKNTDMIHNVYDCGHTTGNAMGNKYFWYSPDMYGRLPHGRCCYETTGRYGGVA